eukprot:3780271-Rhodomonas_salina.1
MSHLPSTAPSPRSPSKRWSRPASTSRAARPHGQRNRLRSPSRTARSPRSSPTAHRLEQGNGGQDAVPGPAPEPRGPATPPRLGLEPHQQQ